MGNENNNIQTLNQYPKDTKSKRRTYINHSKITNNLKNQKNIMNFLIKVENGILLPNLNISNSPTLNNICIPNNALKNNEIKYFQTINDYIDIKLDKDKKYYFNYDNTESKYIKIINDISNNKKNNIYNINNNQIFNKNISKENSLNNQNNNNLSTFESTNRNNYENNFDDESSIINTAFNSLKIFKIGNNNKKEDINNNRIYSPNSIKTYNTNYRISNNFDNYSEYNNNSFMTNNNRIIYNNRMLITSPGSPQGNKTNKRFIKEEAKYPDIPKDKSIKNKSPKNNLRNKDNNKCFTTN